MKEIQSEIKGEHLLWWYSKTTPDACVSFLVYKKVQNIWLINYLDKEAICFLLSVKTLDCQYSYVYIQSN